MRFARLVEQGALWFGIIADEKSDAPTLHPDSLLSFIPSQNDKGWLSLYAINDDTELDLVAAALKYNQGSIAACHFVYVPEELFTDHGLEWRRSLGETFHPSVNEKHIEVNIPYLTTLVKVVGLFASGEYYLVEKPVVQDCLGQSAEQNAIDLKGILKKINGSVATRTLELVQGQHLTLAPAKQ